MDNKSVTIYFDGSQIECDPSKSILDNLLDQGVKASFSCKKGSCLTCVLQTDNTVAAKALEGLKPTMVEQGFFLACQAEPTEGMLVQSIDQNKLFIGAHVDKIIKLPGDVCQVFITPEADFSFKPGQFINILGPNGNVRSYSIASLTSEGKTTLELHVKIHAFGLVSGWLGNALLANDKLQFSGPYGDCFYLNGAPEQPLLLVGTGTGLSPLIGIIREALSQDHTGDIKLYHGALDEEGLYFTDKLVELTKAHSNLEVVFGVLNGTESETHKQGAINEIALANHKDRSIKSMACNC